VVIISRPGIHRRQDELKKTEGRAGAAEQQQEQF
jgi:hypothetical protein